MRSRSIYLLPFLCLGLLLMKWREISVTVMEEREPSAIVCQCPRERRLPTKGDDRTGDLQQGRLLHSHWLRAVEILCSDWLTNT